MITEELRLSLDSYIKSNFVESVELAPDYSIDSEITKDAGVTFTKKESFTLDQLMDEVGESFHDMLFLRIDMSGMTDVEVYKRAKHICYYDSVESVRQSRALEAKNF